jgi:predicted phage gp36 major capsid-like protein
MDNSIIAKLFDAALTIGVMAIAVWWLQKTLAQFIERWDKERKERLDAMQKVQDKQGEEIQELKTENRDCQKDRLQLHRDMLELYRCNPTLKKPPEVS